VAGAQLRHLPREPRARGSGAGRGFHGLGAMAGDEHGAARPQLRAGGQNMLQ